MLIHGKPHFPIPADEGPTGPEGGGGEPAGNSAPPADGQAQGQEPGQGEPLTRSDLDQFKNSMFADMRRMVEGIVKPSRGPSRGKTQEHQDAPKGESSDRQPSGVQSEDVQAMIARERAFTRATARLPINDRQFERLEQMFQIEQPDDPTTWVKDVVADLGLGQTTKEGGSVNGQNNNQGRETPTQPPVSNAGGPASPGEITEDTPLWQLTPEDRAALIRQKGHQWYRNTLRQQMKGRRVRIRDL